MDVSHFAGGHMIISVILACVFLSVLCIVTFVATHFVAAAKSLKSTSVPDGDVLKLPMGKYIAVFATFFGSESMQSVAASTNERLIHAGNPGGKLSGEQFLAILVMISGAMWLFNFIMLFMIGGMSVATIVFPTFLAIVSYVLGNMWLNSIVVDRKKFLVRDFPYFIDMCVMVMGAGSTFPQAIKIYLRENPTGALTSELKNVSSEIDYGKSIIEALTNMESRIESTGIKNALRSLVQGLKMGTPIIESLEEQADAMRFMRSQLAERVAEEMKIRMQGPAMLLLVSVLVLILGPAAVNLKDSGMF